MKKPTLWLLLLLVVSQLDLGAQAASARKRILFLTLSEGFKHAVIPFAIETLQKLAAQEKDFEVTASEDVSLLRADSLKNFDLVLFYTTGELPMTDVEKQDLMKWVRSGKGFAGVHSATDTFYQWPEYGEMIGGYFDGHPWTATSDPVTVKVDDTSHVATRHLGSSFQIQDEIYQYKNYSRDRVHVLMSLDTARTDMTKRGIKRTDGDFALAWVRQWGKGRVFYTALGHRPEVWSDPRFQTHLLNGLRWAMGVVPK
ncbi:MAG: ThuA domain-containing protein [Acidobacteriota bacterium]